MGQDEHEPRTRSWAGSRPLAVCAVLAVVTAGVGAGIVFGPDVWRGVPRGPDSSAADDAPLSPGALLVVGTAEVDVEGGILPLSPSAVGRVKSLPAREGQAVAAGQPLLELDATLADAQVDLAAISLRAANVQLESAQQSVRQHADLVRQQKVAVGVAEIRAKTQKDLTGRAEKMVRDKLLPEDTLDPARDQQRVAEELLRGEKLRLEQLEANDPQLAVRAAQAQVDLAARQLETAREQRRLMTLTAPVGGLVLRVTARLGQVWSGAPGEPAVWLRPDRPWVVRCEVEQQYADRLRPGLPCRVYDDRIDGPAWTGTLKSCSPWVGPRRALSADPLARRDVRVVECTVTLDDPDDRLRVGQRVRVVVHEAP